MALGGGTFVTQNKVLPGVYINYVSVKKVNGTMTNRGVCTIGVELDWGDDDAIIEVEQGDFLTNTKKIFGYSYSDEKMKKLRDLFINAKKAYIYKLNKGTKAENDYATAKKSGKRGNDLSIVVQKDVDESEKFRVKTLLENSVVDEQLVSNKEELKPNDYVDFKSTINLETQTASTPLTGGTNGTVTAENHQNYLKKIEAYSFNVLGVATNDEAIKRLYAAFTKRMREDVGQKFQTVIHDYKADYEGVINVKNPTKGYPADLVYYVTGLQAGTNFNKSCSSHVYDGEFEFKYDYTKSELEKALKNGEFVFHKEGDEASVLSDINSLVTETKEKNSVFKDNQTIRIVDQIAIDITLIFKNKYKGKIPNNRSGRISLWSDITKHHEKMERLEAIEDFDEKDIEIEEGETKKTVLVMEELQVINTMEKLYMVVKVA